jgi:hypothetical protein
VFGIVASVLEELEFVQYLTQYSFRKRYVFLFRGVSVHVTWNTLPSACSRDGGRYTSLGTGTLGVPIGILCGRNGLSASMV